MKVFKKLSFLFVGLPLFFGLLTFFSNSTSAQTTYTCNNGARLTSTGIKQVNSNNTIYTIKLENRASTQCTYTLSAAPTTGWTYAFLQENSNTLEYVGGRITVSGNSSKNFKIKATPASSINAGTYTLRVKVAPSTQGEYEDVSYTKKPSCNKEATLTSTNANGSGDNKSRTYELKLVNNDPSGCAATKYTLSTVTPNNSTWKVTYLTSTGTSLGTTSITRSPGQALNFKIKVMPPSGAAAGDKLIRVSATDPSRVSASKDLTYKIVSGGSGDGGGSNTNCVENAPKLEITPLNRNGEKGSEKQYEVKVTNVDTGKNCQKSVNITLKRDLPGDQNTNWTGRFENNELNVPKGESKKTTLFIKSPKSATLGEKSIIVKASRPVGTKQLTRSKTIKYTVIAGSNNNPTATKKPTNPPTKEPTKKPTATATKTPTPTSGNPPTTCVRKSPLLTIDPESINSLAGKEVAYEVKVKNVDEGPCAERTLTLQRTLPNANWTGSWAGDNSDFKIAKNVEKKFTLKIKSPAGATIGTKNITITLKNNSDQTLETKTAAFVIEGDITNPPNPEDEYTRLNFILGVDGIGTTPRIPLGGNKNPDNITRNLDFKLYNVATNTLTHQVSAPYPFNYNPNSEKFEATYDILSSLLPDGTYNIFVEGSPFLVTQYPGSITVKKGQTTNLNSPNFYMITGNINNSDQSQNKIDILDYNVLIGCSIFAKTTELCDSNENYSKWSDLNDNGVVDQDDYTLWLKEFANQQGAQLPN